MLWLPILGGSLQSYLYNLSHSAIVILDMTTENNLGTFDYFVIVDIFYL